MDSLFHTEVLNDQGLTGTAYVKNGLQVQTSSPTSTEPGTNPEELLGLSWATCLNATIESLLAGRSMKNQSKVEVHVDLHKEPSGVGFYFSLHALISIEGFTLDETNKWIERAHQRCPVSKIIGPYSHLQLEAVPFL